MNATALEKLQAAFPDATISTVLDTAVIAVQPERLIETLSSLKMKGTLNSACCLMSLP